MDLDICRMRRHGDMLTTVQGFGKKKVETTYKLDEAVDFIYKGSRSG